MAKTGHWYWDWGKTSKGFAEALLEAGYTLTNKSVTKIADACQNFLEEEDWDWPRGQRFDASHIETRRAVRGSRAYASGYRGGDADHPWYSGNLHDSIATSVMEGNRIRAIRYMKPGATEYQTYKGQRVDGITAAEDAIRRAAYTFPRGGVSNSLRAVLVVGVPYADDVNKSDGHYDFLSPLQEHFRGSIEAAVEDLPNIAVRPTGKEAPRISSIY